MEDKLCKCQYRLENEAKVEENKMGERKTMLFLAPENTLKGEIKQEDYFLKFPHPKNGVSTMFYVKEGKCMEIIKFDEKYRFWFVGNSVVKDGCLYILTPIDPLFLILPFLKKSAKSGKFVLLDQILVDDKCLLVGRLLEVVSRHDLELVCDSKGGEDYTAYRLNQDRLDKWLQAKVRYLAKHLQKSDISVTGQTSSYYLPTPSKSIEDCTRYAWTILSDYINEEWSNSLKEKLNIEDVKPDITFKQGENYIQPPAKRQRVGGVVEDYRDKSAQVVKKAVKLTSVQKKLQKVDKKGMKSMTSFFQTKPKK